SSASPASTSPTAHFTIILILIVVIINGINIKISGIDIIISMSGNIIIIIIIITIIISGNISIFTNSEENDKICNWQCKIVEILKSGVAKNPKEADAMSKIQSELDDTKIILHNTIEAVLQRGEKLDDLVEKSEGLSMQSKTFYKT
ncbi:synaptobrevin-like protein YKT6, partial [Elysia marginata]